MLSVKARQHARASVVQLRPPPHQFQHSPSDLVGDLSSLSQVHVHIPGCDLKKKSGSPAALSSAMCAEKGSSASGSDVSGANKVIHLS